MTLIWAGNFFWIIVEVSTICTGMRVGQMRVQIVQFVLEYAQGKIVFEILHGHPDEVGPDEVVLIDPAAVSLSRRESQLLRSSGEIAKFDFYSTITVK